MITVIIVSRNRKVYLQEALGSLMNQTFRHFEVILIDNASSDPTRSFVESVTMPGINLKKVLLTEERTISYCRNYPVRHQLLDCNSTHVYFLDDDDAILANTLQRVTRAFKTPEIQVVTTNAVPVFCQGNMLPGFYRYISFKSMVRHLYRAYWVRWGSLLFAEHTWLLHRHFMAHMLNFFFERQLVENTPFNDSISYGEDSLLFAQMQGKVKKARLLPTLFVLYRRHNNNTNAPNNITTKVRVNPLAFSYCRESYSSEELCLVFGLMYIRQLFALDNPNFTQADGPMYLHHYRATSASFRLRLWLFYASHFFYNLLRGSARAVRLLAGSLLRRA